MAQRVAGSKQAVGAGIIGFPRRSLLKSAAGKKNSFRSLGRMINRVAKCLDADDANFGTCRFSINDATTSNLESERASKSLGANTLGPSVFSLSPQHHERGLRE
jgi:hypothetical protein